jgi:hypothetical protein
MLELELGLLALVPALLPPSQFVLATQMSLLLVNAAAISVMSPSLLAKMVYNEITSPTFALVCLLSRRRCEMMLEAENVVCTLSQVATCADMGIDTIGMAPTVEVPRASRSACVSRKVSQGRMKRPCLAGTHGVSKIAFTIEDWNLIGQELPW